ncbi:glycosyltransferase family A protein [Arthrobacter sp. zg-Y877]|uniref:glycosyltransferase family 2 protein n=1 Tax=Arthrobacter sp. zg-Y877 TaxID=3049074 RepID=UPI0025A38DDC|nr:glycosyltransferase family A protein [Arthrobacter sp. zg-Y877]MDM7989803.1 glycosyltransferase family A protein [Arthrobacter sp. zg-Y877]
MTAVDVMFPYYGDVELMKQAARSVMGQQHQDWRLVVIDDGYPDPEPARWFAEITDPRVSYQRNAVNLGANGNYRKAVELVEAPIAVMMGADDIMLPNYLTAVVESFEAFPQASAVQPGVQVIDELSRATTPLGDLVKKAVLPRGNERRLLSGEDLATSLLRAGWHYFPSIAWKSETLKRIGFRSEFDVVQDLALLLDIAADSGSMVLTPELAFLYRRHSGSDSSVRAFDGRRFDEERRFFEGEAVRFRQVGWDRASRAARFHLTSRLNAAALIARSAAGGKFGYIPKLAKHVVG